MLISPRALVAVVVLPLLLGAPQEGRAQGMAAATLHVGARVAPTCSVIADWSPDDVATSPSARVVCARSALRALRVSIESGSGEDITPVVGSGESQRLSGGEVVITLPNVVATLASRGIVSIQPRSIEPGTIVVTFNF